MSIKWCRIVAAQHTSELQVLFQISVNKTNADNLDIRVSVLPYFTFNFVNIVEFSSLKESTYSSFILCNSKFYCTPDINVFIYESRKHFM